MGEEEPAQPGDLAVVGRYRGIEPVIVDGAALESDREARDGRRTGSSPTGRAQAVPLRPPAALTCGPDSCKLGAERGSKVALAFQLGGACDPGRSSLDAFLM